MNIIQGESVTRLTALGIPPEPIAVMNSYGNFLFENGCDCLTPFVVENSEASAGENGSRYFSGEGVLFGIQARHTAANFEISCLKRPNTDLFLLKATKSINNEHWTYGIIIGKQLLHIQQLVQRAANVFG